MKDEIIELLKQIKPGVDYANQESLIGDGILESFDLVTLISLLNNKFNIYISVSDLLPENFETVEAIEELVNRLK